MQSKISMAPAEFHPFQSKPDDALNLSRVDKNQTKPEVPVQMQLPPAHVSQSLLSQVQQVSQSQVPPAQLSQPQLPQAPLSQAPSDVASAQAHPKHVVPFNGLSFHNPFDINSYPITNPPLYDPTMHVPYGSTRHRRISISNGQIGQIVNHEAYFMDEDLFDEFYGPERQRPAFQDDTFAASNGSNLGVNQWNINRGMNQMVPEMPSQPVSVVSGEVTEASNGVSTPVTTANVKEEEPVAGLPPPNHTLIYNNEVIYNPNDGPIPGTAAWKKERLLERNRVAASKCRQRKKQAQQQLQLDISKFETAIQDKEAKLRKYEGLLAMYNSVLKQHFDGKPDALEALRPFVDNPQI